MKNKRFIRWGAVIGAFCLVLAGVVCSTIFTDRTYAAGEFQLDQIRTNAYFKVIYSNLRKCYGQMNNNIEESSTNTLADFGDNKTKTYFTEAARQDDYLAFPYDTGKQNKSSCPKMITGWKTGWLADFFSSAKKGTYGGLLNVNTDAEVPNGYWNNNLEKYSEFLQNIGYKKVSDNSALKDAKCFWLTIKPSQDFITKYGVYYNGENFETQDFCVNLDANGNVTMGNIFALKGKNEYFDGEYDEGHLDDKTNVMYFFFKETGDLYPDYRYDTYTKTDWFLDATLVEIFANYATANGSDRQAIHGLAPDSISNKKQSEDTAYCHQLGYVYCGWDDAGILSARKFYGSISNKNSLLSYNSFRDNLTQIIRQSQEDGVRWFDTASVGNKDDYKPTTNTYVKKTEDVDGIDGMDIFIKYFIKDTSDYKGGVFDPVEQYMLYYTYLKDYYKVSMISDYVDGGVKVKWLNDDKKTYSEVYVYNPKEHANDNQYVLNSNNKWDSSTTLDWYNIALKLQAIDFDSAFAGAENVDSIVGPGLNPGGIAQAPGETGTSNSPVTDKCLKGRAAESLGWLICPILSMVSSASEWLYDRVVEPFLVVEPVLLSSESGTFDGWKIFQNLANTAAIILLLTIIFSQVTGFGIDNYGIKKLLPKFIVAMIMINLSFIICQAAVDLSNIAGKGIKDMFDNMGTQIATISTIPDPATIDAPAITFEKGVGSTLATVGIIGALIGALVLLPGFAAFAIPGVLMALLGAGLSMLIAVLVLFALLTVRKVAVIVLVVLSPLAFACYMLPNTKKLFDKWLSFLKNMLLMFPICGLAIGGGNFVSRIILTSTGEQVPFTLALAAMLAGIVPFFFVPTLIRGSMSVLGNIGGRLSNWAQGLGRSATGAIRGSEGMKRWRTRINAGMNSQGQLTAFGRARTALARRTGHFGARGIARAQAAVAKQHDEDAAASATMRSTLNDRLERVDPKHFTEDTVRDQLIDAMASGDRERAMSILTDANGRFKAKDVAKMFRTAASDARVTGNARGLDKNRDFLAAASRISALSKDVYLKQWAESRGRDTKTGAALSLAAFEAKLNSEPGQVKDGEISDMSSDALERAISGGLVTSAQSQRILADASNYAKMDDASRLIHAANQRGITITKADAGDILTGTSRHGITQADATEWIKPPASDVNVKSGSVSVSGGSVTVAGGTLNTVENVQVVHDVNRVVNVEDVQRVNTVQQVNNVQNVQRVQQVNGVVDVNIRDVNTKGAPQTQPLIVKHDDTPPPPKSKVILPPFS